MLPDKNNPCRSTGIVEALDATHKRMPAFATDRITSLADIADFKEEMSPTDGDNIDDRK